MKWNEVNLENVLQKERNRDEKRNPDKVLEAFKALLKNDDLSDESVAEVFQKEPESQDQIKVKLLDVNRIFSGGQIKKLCTDYRLRFLPARHFKGEIPYEAISHIKKLQRHGSGELTDFKILAPAPMFNLVDQDKDPLLFLALGNNRYYLVHKWGSDLSVFRKLWVFPFRSFKTLISCVAALAMLVVMSIPDEVIMGPHHSNALSLRVIFFFYMFIAFSGLTVLYGFSRMKNFNGTLWDSRYID
ncbi:MAG: hypothetical protein RLP14_01470 [Owenweeksia sp.]